MHRSFSDIESILREGVTGCLSRDAFYAFCKSQNVSFDDVCNSVALAVARRFDASAMTYADADGVMNALSGLMIGHATEQPDACFPEPAWSIYLAFDAGEYDHGDGDNPVDRFTRPLVRQALDDA